MKVFVDTNVILEYFMHREEYVAEKMGCPYFLTFNVKDYPVGDNVPVKVLTPQQFLELRISE